MGWEQVAQAQVSSQGVQGDVWKTLDELPVGTEGLLSLHAPGIGPLMDAWGVEAIVKGVFWAKGVDIKVVDCYGQGNDGYIRFTGSPAAVVAVILALAPVLTALFYLGIVVVVGLFIRKAVSVIEKLVENPWTIVAIGTFVLGGLYLAGRKK
ncbi:MAG: hypothetical protein KJ624_08320 [Chloroflexi bacterium]|nr:hypothetical protein [Chloroflexota bacterium]